MKYYVLLLSLLAVACGSDADSGPPTCEVDERYNPILGRCEPSRIDTNNDPDPTDDAGDTDAEVEPEDDMGEDSPPDMTDPEEDMGPDLPEGLTCLTDLDGDGHYAIACGGDDCDDTNPARNPSQVELCDAIDNNCNMLLNDGIECSFYAHSDTQLYRVDPFKLTATPLGSVPGLFDIDTHPDGTLYGLTSTYLYTYVPQTGAWTQFPNSLGDNLGAANGMAIDVDGTAFVTGNNTLYTVNLTTGRATSVGSGNYSSSGDTVITKQGVLYMTSTRFTGSDTLVLVDGLNGSGQLIGPTNHRGIWGLTAAWGKMYGLTSNGELIEINSGSGQSTLVHTFNGISFYGAASTPDR